MTPRRLASARLLAAVVAAPPAAALGQASDEPSGRQAGETEQRSLADLPPAIRLGVRVESLRRRLPAAPTLVIVESGDAFVDTVDQWSLERRFPVLIDDGTDQAREDIARFVRAFEPERILTWEGAPAEDAPERPLNERADAALAASWGADSADALTARWNELGFVPFGLVVASVDDPAWPAALALGAGRGQPILWTSPVQGRIGGFLSDEELARLDSAVRSALTKLSAPWRETGDVIDALTLCLNMPTRWRQQEPPRRGPRAVTDRLGRLEGGRRYAWTGMVFGSEAQAAYRAMCALFLQPQTAWLFDGYPEKGQFVEYDVAPAVDFLEERGVRVTIDDVPGASLERWRARSGGAIDAGLALVNTRGSRRRFRLFGDWAEGNDVPLLATPALVHFVHSFSAQDVSDAHSIANRWLAMGAYAYVGAVHEPFLQAFNPPARFVARLAAPAPLGAAALRDNAPAWRVGVFGDPLITLGPRAARVEQPVEPAGAASLEERMRAALGAGRLADGAAALIMLGRDIDAARLYTAATEDPDAEVPAELARTLIPALVRLGETDLLIDAARRLGPGHDWSHTLRNLLWHGLRRPMERGDEDALAVLQDHVREASYLSDALALGDAAGRIYSPASRAAVLRSFAERAPSEDARKRLMKQAAASAGR